MNSLKKAAERNLKLFVPLKVVSKRLYLPLIAIYFIDVGGLSIEQIGLYAGIAAVIRMASEIPSGYFSDRVSRKWSLVIMGVSQIITLSFFILMPNPTGILIGVLFDAIANSFFSGIGPALVHESLEVLEREDETAKVLSRAQSKSLFINAFLIAIVPLTYVINPKLPFIIGMLQYTILVLIALNMQDIRKGALKTTEKINRKWLVKHRGYITFAAIYGLFAALCTSPSDFRNLIHQANGIPPEQLGWLFAGASLLASLLGVWIHRLKKLGIKNYLLLDSLVMVIAFSLFIPANAILGVIGFLASMTWWRYRDSIYGDFVLNRYSTDLKSTLLSIKHNFSGLHAVWLPVAMGLIADNYGLYRVFVVLAIFTLVMTIPFYLATVRELD